ncbi:hypothetical protein LS996_27900 (plasmid) [Bacillus cereus]|uniref:hypothetical protein n=1 Tax=Bacillus cereus TaxID=1396 RepID=UPI003DA83436
MGIELIVDKYQNDLPGYDLVGYGEVGFPQYKCRLQCLMLKGKRLPVVDEYVLRLYHERVSLEDMSKVLGIDMELINTSYFNLIHLGLIHENTKWITERGHFYLREYKIDSYEKVIVDIVIDALSGEIKKDRKFMNRWSIRENNLDVLPPLTFVPSVSTLKVSQLKKVMRQYKEMDPDTYNGDLLDIIEVENKQTQFKRLSVLVFSNSMGDIRFMVCDDAQRYEEYESLLMRVEKSGKSVLDYGIGDYFEKANLEYITEIKKDSNKNLSPAEMKNGVYTLLDEVKEKLYISIPLIKNKTLDNYFINLLKEKLQENIQIHLLTSGREFADPFQKQQYEKITELQRKHKNLLVDNNPEIQHPVVIADGKGILSYLVKNELNLPKSKYGITEKGFLLDADQVKTVVNTIFMPVDSMINRQNLISKSELENKLRRIIQLVIEFDEYLLGKNNIGWLGGNSFPDAQRVLESPVATNENRFKVFISSMHTSLGESLEKNGKIHGEPKYFWNYFKNEFPELQKVLHKIRVYRNSTEHLVLEPQAKQNYFRFLDEDLDGAIPFLKDCGYHTLQTKVVMELERALESLLVNKY